MASLGETIVKDVKQGIGDAVDTVVRAPGRIAAKMGLGQANSMTNSKDNKGEQAMKTLSTRLGAAGNAFAGKTQVNTDNHKSLDKMVSGRKVAMKK